MVNPCWKAIGNTEKSEMNGQQRSDIRPGKRVAIILKNDQRTGKLSIGVVKDIITSLTVDDLYPKYPAISPG